MSYTIIKNFDNINIKNALLILDIDETILFFDEITKDWWKTHFDENYKIYKDYEYVEKLCYNKWLKIITTTNPRHTDEHNLYKLLKQNHIFVTAREKYIEHITYSHFNYLHIPTNQNNIYHVGDNDKGIFIKKILQSTYVQNVVFIDDLEKNILNVINATNDLHINLTCYLIDIFMD